jgi:hypothetical protein
MKNEKHGASIDLERAVALLQQERVEDSVIEGAARQLRARLLGLVGPQDEQTSVKSIRGCDDFRALIPAYLSQNLSEARRLLVEDHLRDCVACRNAVKVARGDAASNRDLRVAAPFQSRKWLLAGVAGVVLAVVAAGILLLPGLLFNRGEVATIQAVEGHIFSVSTQQTLPLAAGARVTAGEEVRTAGASRAAIRLEDGSSIEMGERADLWVSRAWSGATIHLRQGSVIVQAAKQPGRRRLQVATPDCLVSVKGTIFAVTQGIGAARVAVIQGVVVVHHMRHAHVLEAGDEYSTGASLANVPIGEDIAWSQHSGHYLALLGELAHIQKQLESMPGPPLRYYSRLARYLPRNTVVYAAIPNLEPTLKDAQSLFEQRLQSSPVLRNWWNQQMASGTAEVLAVAFGEVRVISDYLGSEIVMGWSQGSQGRRPFPVILAEVQKPGFRAFLQSQLDMRRGGPSRPSRGSTARVFPYIVTDPSDVVSEPRSQTGVYILIKHHVVVLTTSPETLRTEANLIEHEQPGGFVTTRFYSAIQQYYRNGAGWLLWADLEQMTRHSVSIETHVQTRERSQTGFEDVKYLVIERKKWEGQTESRAVLSFGHSRQGIAAWLAAPSPMGALTFVSPDAAFVLSLVLKSPESMVNDAFRIAGGKDHAFKRNLSALQSDSRMAIGADFAASLGGEITFAQDGPLFPTPAWVAVLETYRPRLLQTAIEHLIGQVNQVFTSSTPPLRFTKTRADGRTDYTLQFSPPGSSKAYQVVYAFDDGYMILAPNPATLARAIQNHESGYTLTRSAEFQAAMPRDENPYCSALVYGNLKAQLSGITSWLESSRTVTPEERDAVQKLGQDSHATVACAYGEPDRITLAASGGFFGLDLEMLAKLASGESLLRSRLPTGPPPRPNQ